LQQAAASASASSLSQSIGVSSTGTPVQFTAEALGGPWLTVSPSGGTTSGEVTVTAAPEGLAKGKYAGQVRLSAPGINSVTVPADDPEDRANEGLVLVNNAAAGSKARAGVKLQNVEGIVLSVLGFDIRQGSLCTLKGPRFVVVTADAVVHTLGGCGLANAQPSPAKGWQRFRFDPAKAVPAIAPDSMIKSIALVLEDGPDADGGMVVLDNINVNGNFVGHE
jgi:hypothetical protein